jgi:hypothetical protein
VVTLTLRIHTRTVEPDLLSREFNEINGAALHYIEALKFETRFMIEKHHACRHLRSGNGTFSKEAGAATWDMKAAFQAKIYTTTAAQHQTGNDMKASQTD